MPPSDDRFLNMLVLVSRFFLVCTVNNHAFLSLVDALLPSVIHASVQVDACRLFPAAAETLTLLHKQYCCRYPAYKATVKQHLWKALQIQGRSRQGTSAIGLDEAVVLARTQCLRWHIVSNMHAMQCCSRFVQHLVEGGCSYPVHNSNNPVASVVVPSVDSQNSSQQSTGIAFTMALLPATNFSRHVAGTRPAAVARNVVCKSKVLHGEHGHGDHTLPWFKKRTVRGCQVTGAEHGQIACIMLLSGPMDTGACTNSGSGMPDLLFCCYIVPSVSGHRQQPCLLTFQQQQQRIPIKRC